MTADDLFQQPEIGLDRACADVDASTPEDRVGGVHHNDADITLSESTVESIEFVE